MVGPILTSFRRSCSLIDELSGHIDTLNDIGNIDNIFVCKIPPRLDSSKINDKVRLYNNKLCVRFRDSIKTRLLNVFHQK